MDDKCKWVDGKFYSCNKHSDSWDSIWDRTGWEYCPFCGANIEKPKPTIIEQDFKVRVTKIAESNKILVTYLQNSKAVAEVVYDPATYHLRGHSVIPFGQAVVNKMIRELLGN